MSESMSTDFKSLLHWPNTNKVNLNVTKTEVVANSRVFDTDLKLKMYGKQVIFQKVSACMQFFRKGAKKDKIFENLSKNVQRIFKNILKKGSLMRATIACMTQ